MIAKIELIKAIIPVIQKNCLTPGLISLRGSTEAKVSPETCPVFSDWD